MAVIAASGGEHFAPILKISRPLVVLDQFRELVELPLAYKRPGLDLQLDGSLDVRLVDQVSQLAAVLCRELGEKLLARDSQIAEERHAAGHLRRLIEPLEQVSPLVDVPALI